MKKNILIMLLVIISLCTLSSCGKDNEDKPELYSEIKLEGFYEPFVDIDFTAPDETVLIFSYNEKGSVVSAEVEKYYFTRDAARTDYSALAADDKLSEIF